ncbi:hypothetical protein D3C71_1801820 [compost metagenome]
MAGGAVEHDGHRGRDHGPRHQGVLVAVEEHKGDVRCAGERHASLGADKNEELSFADHPGFPEDHDRRDVLVFHATPKQPKPAGDIQQSGRTRKTYGLSGGAKRHGR